MKLFLFSLATISLVPALAIAGPACDEATQELIRQGNPAAVGYIEGRFSALVDLRKALSEAFEQEERAEGSRSLFTPAKNARATGRYQAFTRAFEAMRARLVELRPCRQLIQQNK